MITGMGGNGAAAGLLIGGLITTAISWRAAFVFQALVFGLIVVLSRAMVDPLPITPAQPFDTLGAVLSAVGLVLVVMGVLAADDNAALMVGLLAVGTVLIVLFFVHIRARERAEREPLLSTAVFRNRIANLRLVTQNVQWLLLMGTVFVVSAYLVAGFVTTIAGIGLLLVLVAGTRARGPSRRGCCSSASASASC